MDDGKGLFQRPNGSASHHSESVKRQLESYDVETSLNEVCFFRPSGFLKLADVNLFYYRSPMVVLELLNLLESTEIEHIRRNGLVQTLVHYLPSKRWRT